MTTKNTETKKATTTKAKATATKAVAAPKKEKPVATPKKVDYSLLVPLDSSTNPYQKELVAEFKKRTENIKKTMSGIEKSMETIAFSLYWIYIKQAYKSVGCDTLVQYAGKTFGYSKSTCYNFISIIERFAAKDDKGNMLEQLDPSVKGYSISKLSLMVGLTDEQIKTLKPEMSARDIAKYVKSLQDKKMPELPEGNGNGEEKEKVVDSTATDFYDKVLFTCKGFEDYNKKLDKIDETIHKIYEQMPDVSIKFIVERNGKPIEGKWGE